MILYTLKLAVPLPERKATTNITLNVTSLSAAQQVRTFAQSQGWDVVQQTTSHSCDTLDEAKAAIGQHIKDCGDRWLHLPRRVSW